MLNRAENKRQHGAAALELALMLPIFLLLLVGILEFGRAIMLHQILTNGTREAARQAIVKGASDSTIISAVNDYLDSASVQSSGRVIEIQNGSGQATTVASIGSHEKITVFVSIPFDENSFGMTDWFLGESIVTRISMRRE